MCGRVLESDKEIRKIVTDQFPPFSVRGGLSWDDSRGYYLNHYQGYRDDPSQWTVLRLPDAWSR